MRQRVRLPADRSLLVGVSGIDGCGKGYIAKQLEARLAQHAIPTAHINADGWLNLPDKRFNQIEPGKHFYQNAIRFDELFRKLLIPLRDRRSINVVVDFAEERAKTYHKRAYAFKNVGVIIVEGIFLFKREYRKLFDLAIWIDCSFTTALACALARAQEGLPTAETLKAYETIYFPAQMIHKDCDNPRTSADLILDNDPSLVRQPSF